MALAVMFSAPVLRVRI